ncbi:MAG: hypothetical protein A2086_12390 [Spirochaetes bacterium GWD1_27_9]|nr:MAG: hypothetical protein A2Z98_15235 [Spirochaetes bacterium GWB1_27_13]OHD27010.1 MAG: hypothetical protein A2Y34_07730 [Spirochaetes bacterium GWC1_27_15]OHD33251.1 MAG: hypothetical protein A2086_12390 [Spirochaetes bacterium GWD1_27_9]
MLNFKILIIDDDNMGLEVISSIIQKAGYTVTSVNSAKLAIAILKDFTPDLILLDLMMPEMDGFSFLKIIKADVNLKKIPVIVLSAKIDKKDVVEAFKLGAVDYVTKPYDSIEIIARINIHLELKKTKDELEERVNELQHALNEIDTLRNLLPICASCKRIRDDKGYWHQVEDYITKNYKIKFSHSLCKECAQKLYPEYYDE